jgi:phospholipid transport system substrate-binding protein
MSQAQGPAAVVKTFQDELISVMKAADRLDYEGRYERLAPAVRASHDLAAIAQIALGQYWDDLSEAQREQLVETFGRLSIATYAHRFDGYSGETFEIQSDEKLSPHVAAVHSVLTQSDGEEIRFDYVLRRDQGAFRIVNIVVDGVSDLALKRSEYGEILGDDGFDALIKQLEAKIADYSQSPSA